MTGNHGPTAFATITSYNVNNLAFKNASLRSSLKNQQKHYSCPKKLSHSEGGNIMDIKYRYTSTDINLCLDQ